jgi:hypothetical protein
MGNEERRAEERRGAFHRRKRSNPNFKRRDRRDSLNRRSENERRKSR